MTHIDYSISRVDDLGAIHEATYMVRPVIKERRDAFEITSKRIYTGIQITFPKDYTYPKDYPNYALRGVKIWYSIESLTTLL